MAGPTARGRGLLEDLRQQPHDGGLGGAGVQVLRPAAVGLAGARLRQLVRVGRGAFRRAASTEQPLLPDEPVARHPSVARTSCTPARRPAAPWAAGSCSGARRTRARSPRPGSARGAPVRRGSGVRRPSGAGPAPPRPAPRPGTSRRRPPSRPCSSTAGSGALPHPGQVGACRPQDGQPGTYWSDASQPLHRPGLPFACSNTAVHRRARRRPCPAAPRRTRPLRTHRTRRASGPGRRCCASSSGSRDRARLHGAHQPSGSFPEAGLPVARLQLARRRLSLLRSGARAASRRARARAAPPGRPGTGRGGWGARGCPPGARRPPAPRGAPAGG